MTVDSEGQDAREVERLLLQAIADPGHFTPRGDDYTESIPCWGARAALAAIFAAAGVEGPGTVALVRGEDGAVTIKRASDSGYALAKDVGCNHGTWDYCPGNGKHATEWPLYRLVDGEPT